MPEADWVAEFGMVNLYLKMDPRNCKLLAHRVRVGPTRPNLGAAENSHLPKTRA